nr:hypothetical protein [Tanacetum cinerariifolium]
EAIKEELLTQKEEMELENYALWDVIENGNSFKSLAQTTTNDVGTSTTLIPGPYKDAKTLFAAIEIRFGRSQFNVLRSFPSELNTYVVVWRNKSDLDKMSIDDLYNNFKIVEQEVKGTACSDLSSQNIAFMTSPSTNSTNEVPTAYRVSIASTQSSTTITKVSTPDLTDATVYEYLSNPSNGS